ncbi:MAG: tRNA lysidine(34) synthetase TilS, partial [Pseudomonadota bacterium]
MNECEASLIADVRAQFPDAPPSRLGIAVSGGSDSMALLHLCHRTLGAEGVEIFAATVDHGLRPDAVEEATLVARNAANLGVSHNILKWDGWDGCGNLQDKARQARYDLLTGWAQQNEISVLALGHTADDQAETFLMRLARNAGLVGLSGMSPRRMQDGIVLMRPLLQVTRSRLRSFLVQNQLPWADDPSNRDPRFERVRARQALEQMQPLGITSTVLAEVAQNLSQARDALDWFVFLAARENIRIEDGNVLIRQRGFRTLPEEVARRLLVQAVTWISGAKYAPRRSAIRAAMQAVRHEKPVVLAGCHILHKDGYAIVCREFNAVKDLMVPLGQVWDGRWKLMGPVLEGGQIRAMGDDGLMQCPDWRASGKPHG